MVTIENEALVELAETLRISSEQWKHVFAGQDSPANDLIFRICKARLLLGLSNSNQQACHDYKVV